MTAALQMAIGLGTVATVIVVWHWLEPAVVKNSLTMIMRSTYNGLLAYAWLARSKDRIHHSLTFVAAQKLPVHVVMVGVAPKL